MASLHKTSSIVLLALLGSFASAYDNIPLQDFCVAAPDAQTAVFVNGKVCKNPKDVKADDFYLAARLHTPAGNPNNTSLGVFPNLVDVNRLHGLNTMGLSIARADFAPKGLIQLHTHPRASEIVIVLEGTVYVGFVTTNPLNNNEKNTLFTKILYPGDVFIFPLGLVHFLFNVGPTNAVVLAFFNSQNPGFNLLPNILFGSVPPISDDVLSKAFRLDKKVIDYLQSLNYTFT